MTQKIAITPRSLSSAGHPALSELTTRGFELVFPAPGKTPDVEALLEHIPECVGWLAGVEPIGKRVLSASNGLKVISRNGSGVDNINLEIAHQRGIVVERAGGANARGVAELTIGMMLSAFRHIPWSDAQLRAGDWKRRKGVEAAGRTLGVIGCGAIGRTVATIATGLGMKVVGYDPFPIRDFQLNGFNQTTLEELFEKSDAISFHCPPSDNPLIDAGVISQLKKGCVIINTARAELVDDGAVLAALESGKVSIYATDVYRSEPPSPSALLEHDRTILTPHAGGFTDESVDRATQIAVANLLKILV